MKKEDNTLFNTNFTIRGIFVFIWILFCIICLGDLTYYAINNIHQVSAFEWKIGYLALVSLIFMIHEAIYIHDKYQDSVNDDDNVTIS